MIQVNDKRQQPSTEHLLRCLGNLTTKIANPLHLIPPALVVVVLRSPAIVTLLEAGLIITDFQLVMRRGVPSFGERTYHCDGVPGWREMSRLNVLYVIRGLRTSCVASLLIKLPGPIVESVHNNEGDIGGVPGLVGVLLVSHRCSV